MAMHLAITLTNMHSLYQFLFPNLTSGGPIYFFSWNNIPLCGVFYSKKNKNNTISDFETLGSNASAIIWLYLFFEHFSQKVIL